MKRLIQAFVIAVAVAAGMTGCAVTGGQETTGQYVDDATITTRVKTRFAKDPTVSAMRINVETMKGVVQLSGNRRVKQSATRLRNSPVRCPA